MRVRHCSLSPSSLNPESKDNISFGYFNQAQSWEMLSRFSYQQEECKHRSWTLAKVHTLILSRLPCGLEPAVPWLPMKSKPLSYNLLGAVAWREPSPTLPSRSWFLWPVCSFQHPASLQKHRQEPPLSWCFAGVPHSGSPADHWPSTRFPVYAPSLFVYTQTPYAQDKCTTHMHTYTAEHS